MNAEQIVNDSGRVPATKVAPVYSPLVSGLKSLSAEKSRTLVVFEIEDLCCRSRLLFKTVPSITDPLFLFDRSSSGRRRPKMNIIEREKKAENIFISLDLNDFRL